MSRTISYLATARVLYERVRANRVARKLLRAAAIVLVAALIVNAYTLVIIRYAGNKAVETYKAQLEAEAEAERIAAEKAPYTIQLEQEAMLGAQLLEGVKLFHYDDANKKTLLQCIANRVLNPAYPSTVEEVLTERGQFDFFDPASPATEENYGLCYAFFDNFHRQERLTCSYDYVFVELGDKVVLRDTFNKGYDTHTWWWGK